MALHSSSKGVSDRSDPALHQYFARKAVRYESETARWPWSWQRRREAAAIFALLGDIAGLRALDLGCGSGFYTRRMISGGVAEVTAVDNCAEMVAVLPENGRLTPLVCDAETLPAMEPFERIVSAGLLEFAEHPDRVLARARGVVADHGLLVLMVPARNTGGRLYARWHAGHALAVRLFLQRDLADLAVATGWRLAATRFVWPFSLAARLEPVP